MWFESFGYRIPTDKLPYSYFLFLVVLIRLQEIFLFLCPFYFFALIRKSIRLINLQWHFKLTISFTQEKKDSNNPYLDKCNLTGYVYSETQAFVLLDSNFNSSQQGINLTNWVICRATFLKAFSRGQTWTSNTPAIALVTRILILLGTEMSTKGFGIENQLIYSKHAL